MTTKDFLSAMIAKAPGLYFQQIVRSAGLPVGTVDYSLWRLQKEGTIKSEIIFGKKRFFEHSFANARIYGLLQEDIVREIVTLLMAQKTQVQIAHKVRLSKSTVSWYIKRMQKEGLINEFSRRYVVIEEQKVKEILDSKSTKNLVNNFISMWEK